MSSDQPPGFDPDDALGWISTGLIGNKSKKWAKWWFERFLPACGRYAAQYYFSHGDFRYNGYKNSERQNPQKDSTTNDWKGDGTSQQLLIGMALNEGRYSWNPLMGDRSSSVDGMGDTIDVDPPYPKHGIFKTGSDGRGSEKILNIRDAFMDYQGGPGSNQSHSSYKDVIRDDQGYGGNIKYWQSRQYDYKKLAKSEIAEVCRELVSGDMTSWFPDMRTSKNEGVWICSSQQKFFVKQGGVDPTKSLGWVTKTGKHNNDTINDYVRFNLVMNSMFGNSSYGSKFTADALDGPEDPTKMNAAGWKIIKHKNKNTAPLIAAFMSGPYKTVTEKEIIDYGWDKSWDGKQFNLGGKLTQKNIKDQGYKWGCTPINTDEKGLQGGSVGPNIPSYARQVMNGANNFIYYDRLKSKFNKGGGHSGGFPTYMAITSYGHYGKHHGLTRWGAGNLVLMGYKAAEDNQWGGRPQPQYLYIDYLSLFWEWQRTILAFGASLQNPAFVNAVREVMKGDEGVPGKGGPDLGGRPSRTGTSTPPVPEPLAPQDKRALREGEVYAVDVQCYLLEHLRKLAVAHAGDSYTHIGKMGMAQPGNIISKINHGQGLFNDDKILALQALCPDVWALLVPHIELFRVDYKPIRPGSDQYVPYQELRIPFSNFIDPNDVSQITKGKYGRIGGAGIKSFTWSLDGVQPAEVDNIISANLVLHFQSVFDLFRFNKNAAGGYQGGIPDQPGYLDLIIGSGTTVTQAEREAQEEEGKIGAKLDDEPDLSPPCNIDAQVYEGAAYRIKALVGWSTPPDFGQLDILDQDQIKISMVQKAIDESRIALHLQIVSHELRFEQNGTIELSIDYQASLSGIMRSPSADIFIAKELNSEDVKKLEEEIAALEKKQRQGKGDPTFDDKIREKQQKVISLMKLDRLRKYNKFLQSLYDRDQIYGIRIPSEQLLNPLGKMTPAMRAEEAKKRSQMTLSPEPVPAAEVASTEEVTTVVTEVSKDETTPPKEEDTDTRSAELKEMADNVGIFATGGQDNVLIPYMYLGDLFDAVFDIQLQHLVQENGADAAQMQMVLGRIELIDPLAAYQIKQVTYECPGKSETALKRLRDIDPLRFKKLAGITTHMDIGSIPISLDKFNEWFLDTVIRKKKDSYFLLNFIKDVCAGLLGTAFNEACFEDLSFNLRFDTANFRLNKSFKGKNNIPLDGKEGLAAAHIAARKLDQFSLHAQRANTLIPTTVLYSVDSRPDTGDRMSDLKEGIYHYFLGGRCGLAKEIVFNREDMPGYREARIDKDGSLGAQQLKELYSVNMNMIGNNFHKNGTFVYIDPIAIGAGSAKAIGGIPNIARLIGLGGYFLVTGVNHQLGPEGYTTSVKAIQQMVPFDTNFNEKVVKIESFTAAELLGETIEPLNLNPAEEHAAEEIEKKQSLVPATAPETDAILAPAPEKFSTDIDDLTLIVGTGEDSRDLAAEMAANGYTQDEIRLFMGFVQSSDISQEKAIAMAEAPPEEARLLGGF